MFKFIKKNTKQRKAMHVLGSILVLVLLMATVSAGCSLEKKADATTSATTKENKSGSSRKESSPNTKANAKTSGVFARTTTRSYSDKAVPEELIKKIIQAGFASPTAGGQYANEYIVINDRKVMKDMMGGNPYAQALETAPVVIVIAGNENRARYKDLLMLDGGIATQSIMVAASELGLSSVPMSIAPVPRRMEAVAKALKFPEGVKAQMMVAMGYPSVDGNTSASVNYYNKEEVHYNQW